MKLKVIRTKTECTCEVCGRTVKEIYIVGFERANETYLLCDACLEWTRKVLELVDVKEAEA